MGAPGGPELVWAPTAHARRLTTCCSSGRYKEAAGGGAAAADGDASCAAGAEVQSLPLSYDLTWTSDPPRV